MKSNRWFIKAERFILSAQILADQNDLDSAASRLYYAMFYIAQALLESIGLSFSSHKAVISAFGQHFSKTGVLDSRFHRMLVNAFSQRQLGDYALVSGLERSDIDIMLNGAKDFLNSGKSWLQAHKKEE